MDLYPEEIEMLLEKLDEIKEVMVYGKEPESGLVSRLRLLRTSRIC